MGCEEHGHSAFSDHGCSCCTGSQLAAAGPSRRGFMLGMAAPAVGALAVSAMTAATGKGEEKAAPKIAPAKELVVQPVLTYQLYKPAKQTSWRPWGGLMSEADVDAEAKRIDQELAQLVKSSGLAIKFLPVGRARSKAEADKIAQTPSDVRLVYASGGGEDVLQAFVSKDRPCIFFLRHNSGPVSLYYEILHPRFLRKGTDDYCQADVDVRDVVVDEYADLTWRLRALVGLRKTLGQRIVAIGGAGGWCQGNELAPRISREKWQLDIIDEPYPKLGERIEKARKNQALVSEALKAAEAYLSQPTIKMETDRKVLDNAFILYRVFKDLMAEHNATAMTINSCMGTIMPMSETTACLPLSLINDEGMLAFCESDFVVIPAGILMHHITGTPPFLNDPTWPHHGVITLAHCTAPRKMDGKTYEPTRILTHFESDYGAAPKVEMRNGQVVTNVIPDFHAATWVGVRGKIVGSPFHAICRSQIDVALEGCCDRLAQDMRGFHWMTIYGDCMKEVEYAIKHVGIKWENISA